MAEASNIGVQESVVKDTFLTCSICLERFNNPKILPCLHTFCLMCLDGYIEKTLENGQFYCPCCRTVTEVPPFGSGEFKNNFFMNSLVDFFWTDNAKQPCSFCFEDGHTVQAVSKCTDCSDYLCAGCSDFHCRTKLTRNHKIVDLESDREKKLKQLKTDKQVPCPSHPESFVEEFCVECEQTICNECKGASHQDHKYLAFQEAIGERKPIIQQKYERLLEQCQKKESILAGLGKHQKDVQHEYKIFVQEIDAIFESISVLKVQVLENAENTCHQFLKQGDVTIEETIASLERLHSCKEYLSTSLHKAPDLEILDSFKLMTEHCESLLRDNKHTESMSIQEYLESKWCAVTQFVFDCKKALDDVLESMKVKKTSRILKLARLSVQKILFPENGKVSSLLMSEDGDLYVCFDGRVYHYSKRWVNISSSLGLQKDVKAHDIKLGRNTLYVSTTYPMVGGKNNRNVRLVVYSMVTKTFTLAELGASNSCPFICLKRNTASIYVALGNRVKEITTSGIELRSSRFLNVQPSHLEECTDGTILYHDSFSGIYRLGGDLTPVAGSKINLFTNPTGLQIDEAGSIYFTSENILCRILSDGLTYEVMLSAKDGILNPGPLCITGNKLAVVDLNMVWIYTMK